MARSSVELSTEGFDSLAALFSKWDSRIDDASGAFDEMADVVAENQKEWFRTGGKGSWQPRSEPYHKWMRKKFPKRKVMHGPDTKNHRGLQLRDQLTRRSNGKFGVEKITARSMTIGTDLPYAEMHAEGQGRLPRRDPMAPLTGAVIDDMTKILQVHIVGEAMGG
jgi:hypothetical protein